LIEQTKVAMRIRLAIPVLMTALFAPLSMAHAEPDPHEVALMAQRARVAAATVTLPERSCAGVVVGEADRVVTAAHCVPQGAWSADVALRDGRTLEASIVHLDRDADLAVLLLDEQLTVKPLQIASESPQPGDRVLFVGRVDRKSRPQVARIERVGVCPSLPSVPDALFTTVKARPGDSGAPLVDESLRVVGLIHGGARCHIAAPTSQLAVRLNPSPPAAAPAPSPPSQATAPQPKLHGAERKTLGPFVYERTPNGFRFQFSFSWRSDP
jgi:S1-C subfamily serine protease